MSYIETHEDLRRTREARVMEIISDELWNAEVKPEYELELSPMGFAELAMRFEVEFNIELSAAALTQCVTVADAIELVHRRVEYAETEGRG